MKDEVRDKIVDLLKSHSKEKGNARVGWAVKAATGNPLPRYEIEKIVGLIERDKDYKVVKKGSDDFNVRYVGRSWSERHPILDKFRTGAITALFSLTVGIGIYVLTTQKQNLRETLQDKRIDNLSDSLTMLQKHIEDSAVINKFNHYELRKA